MSDKQREIEIRGRKFVVEKEIERSPYRGAMAPWRELIKSMEVDESIIFSKRDAINFQGCVRSHGYKITMRKLGEDKYRVWRDE